MVPEDLTAEVISLGKERGRSGYCRLPHPGSTDHASSRSHSAVARGAGGHEDARLAEALVDALLTTASAGA
jgi:hypothetical protein